MTTVVVLGTAGIGKTALVDRLRGARKAEGLTFIEARDAGIAPLHDADGAVVVIDAVRGLDAAGRAAILAAHAAGVPSVVVAANRMDRAGFEYEVFKSIRAQVARLGVDAVTVPVSALLDFNVGTRGEALEWHVDRSLLDVLRAAALRRADELVLA